MAFNPQLIHGADFSYPANKGSEYTYMRADGVKLKLYLPDRTIKEDGMMFLTSTRLVFVKSPKSRTNAHFKGIEMPLNLIDKPKFEQPVFGMNYLSGTVRPLVGDPNCLQGNCVWNLFFASGNSEKFLSAFSHVYEELKKKKTVPNVERTQDQFLYTNNAYIDPNDPSHIYIHEPINPNIYQPQNLSHNHYVPLTNNNMSSSNYPGNSMTNNYGNTCSPPKNNATIAYPLRSITEQTVVYESRPNCGENNMMPYPPQNNISHPQTYSMQNIPQGNQTGNPHYLHQPAQIYGQNNYNPQGQVTYGQHGQPGQPAYNPYNQQNYEQQHYMGMNNEIRSSRQNAGYTPTNISYQEQTNGNGPQQYNRMNFPWNNSQQPNQSCVTELTRQQNNQYNMPYKR